MTLKTSFSLEVTNNFLNDFNTILDTSKTVKLFPLEDKWDYLSRWQTEQKHSDPHFLLIQRNAR